MSKTNKINNEKASNTKSNKSSTWTTKVVELTMDINAVTEDINNKSMRNTKTTSINKLYKSSKKVYVPIIRKNY